MRSRTPCLRHRAFELTDNDEACSRARLGFRRSYRTTPTISSSGAAIAEPGGTVLTGDRADRSARAHADIVHVEPV